jgi:hypothetical protein
VLWAGGQTGCRPEVVFTVPDQFFGGRTRLLGIDLQAAGDNVQRGIGEASGIRYVYEALFLRLDTTFECSAGEPRVSPEFPLTPDGLEGVIVGTTPPWPSPPFGWVYLATRPASGVEQVLAEGVIYGESGDLVFGGQGVFTKVRFEDGRGFSLKSKPFYSQLETAYIDIPDRTVTQTIVDHYECQNVLVGYNYYTSPTTGNQIPYPVYQTRCDIPVYSTRTTTIPGKKVLLYGSWPKKTVTIKAAVSGAVTDTVLVATIDGREVGRISAGEGTHTVFSGGVDLGSHTVAVTAMDALGRRASDTKSFEVRL